MDTRSSVQCRDVKICRSINYVYWALMAKHGIPAEIVLANQLVGSVEYLSTPVHMAICGGITGGSAECNPASGFGASVWISLVPFLMQDRQVRELRGGAVYSQRHALRYAGVMLAMNSGTRCFTSNIPGRARPVSCGPPRCWTSPAGRKI